MLLVNDEEQVPELPTDQEKALTDALTSEKLLAIDQAIVNATEQRWLKVARIVFDAIKAGGFSMVDEQVQLHVRRIITLVRAGRPTAHSVGRAFVITFLCITAGARADSDLAGRKRKIESMDRAPTAEAKARKQRSETVLRAEAVPVNAALPVIETENRARRRSKEEVAYRALALLTVAVRGEGLDEGTTQKIVKLYGLAPHFTPKERAFLQDDSASQQDRAQFTWRYEAAWTLLWAIGFVDKLEKPSKICDVSRAVRLMKERTVQRFITESKLRSLREILDQADRIYRYHWAVVDARVKGQPSPAGLEPDVTVERHHALNWLIGYMDQEWDDVTTDT